MKTNVVITTKIKTITDTCPCKDRPDTKWRVIYENVDAPALRVGTRTVTCPLQGRIAGAQNTRTLTRPYPPIKNVPTFSLKSPLLLKSIMKRNQLIFSVKNFE